MFISVGYFPLFFPQWGNQASIMDIKFCIPYPSFWSWGKFHGRMHLSTKSTMPCRVQGTRFINSIPSIRFPLWILLGERDDSHRIYPLSPSLQFSCCVDAYSTGFLDTVAFTPKAGEHNRPVSLHAALHSRLAPFKYSNWSTHLEPLWSTQMTASERGL